MKKLLMVLIIAHSLAFVCNAEQEIRGLWVATVFQLDFPSQAGLSPDQLRWELEALVQKTKDAGFNALFFQVRPSADAFYDSDIFPWSAWLTGTQGAPPADDFDPLAFLSKLAKDADIDLHAWVNPFRITRNKTDSKVQALATLSAAHPARLNPEWTVFHSDGCLYFDPGLPEVRQLVRNGICEIAKKYDIAGIHLDDYFYPGRDFADNASFLLHGAQFDSRDSFRTASVNSLIAGIHTDLCKINPDLRFGVSPTGIWANADTDPRGSNTIGYESKTETYADTLSWMEAGTVDYIAPQLYWAIGAREGEFTTLLDWWQKQAARTGTDLLIGLAGYRTAEADDPSNVWYGGDELSRQLALISGVTEGYILFRAGSLFDSPAVAACFAGTDTAAPLESKYLPVARQWLAVGDTLEVTCNSTVPTLAMWNDHSVLLTRDSTEKQSGSLTILAVGSAPVLYVHFRGSCLLTQFSPGVITVPQPVEILSYQESVCVDGTAFTFCFSAPAEANCTLSGSQILVDIPALKLPLLFESKLLTAIDCVPISPGTRYILTPALPPTAYSISKEGTDVTIFIR